MMPIAYAETCQPAKTARLEARITEEQKVLLQRAAALAGRSLSDFIVSSAQEAAVRTIHDNELISLCAEECNAFVKTLLNPPEPGERLKKAAQTYRQKTGA
jgi:uncharacterized protein (DUF1778 family)